MFDALSKIPEQAMTGFDKFQKLPKDKQAETLLLGAGAAGFAYLVTQFPTTVSLLAFGFTVIKQVHSPEIEKTQSYTGKIFSYVTGK